MSFVDQANVKVIAGKGGDGRISFRREKFVSRGGPDGGDGGDGGDVVLSASNNQDSLASFRINKTLRAADGASGGNKKQHGKTGPDLIVKVPVGTAAKDLDGKLVADLTLDGQTTVVARGGQGGFGNAHFVSSRRQSPHFAEKGEPGATLELKLELKLLADVGLVGLPNAGKSTLLGALSNAHPKVGDYPFTTLDPMVGVVDVDQNTSLLLADIPGLIEGAAKGKGLGHDFLRHIERTAVIVHLIDAYAPNVAEAYNIIRRELAAYSPELAKRPEIVALNKVEGLDSEITDDLISSLRRVIKPSKTQVLLVSAKSGLGLRELVFAAQATKAAVDAKRRSSSEEPLYRYNLPANLSGWSVKRVRGHYRIEGRQIERLALKTDFGNDQAVARLMDILRKRGVIRALIRQGIQPGDKVDVAGAGEVIF